MGNRDEHQSKYNVSLAKETKTNAQKKHGVAHKPVEQARPDVSLLSNTVAIAELQ